MELSHIEATVDRHAESVLDFETRCDALLERERILTEVITVLRASEDAVSSADLQHALSDATGIEQETALERLTVTTDIADTLAESQRHRQIVERAYEQRNAGLTRVALFALSTEGASRLMAQSMKETLQLDLSRLYRVDADLLSMESRLQHLLNTVE